MKTLHLIVIGSLMAACVCAQAQGVLTKTRSARELGEYYQRNGLGVGGGGAPGSAVSKAVPDDWREIDGQIYNVAVKQRWAESRQEKERWEKSGVFGEIMPGWELLQGTVTRATNGVWIHGRTWIMEDGERRWYESNKLIRDAKSEFFKPGQTVAYYCFKRGAEVYEYGKHLEAREALARIGESKAQMEKKSLTAEGK